MFDFFEEIAEFLSQLVANTNSFQSFLTDAVYSFSDVLEWVKDFSSNLGAPFSWCIPIVMLFTVFDFIRGRG